MSYISLVKSTAIDKLLTKRCLLVTGLLLLIFTALAGTGSETYFFIGAPALSTSNLSTSGGVMFELRFDVETLEGDLIARDVSADGLLVQYDTVDTDGNITVNAKWQGKTEITAQSARGGNPDNRIIFTSDAGGGRRLHWDSTDGDDSALTNDMKALISSTDPS